MSQMIFIQFYLVCVSFLFSWANRRADNKIAITRSWRNIITRACTVDIRTPMSFFSSWFADDVNINNLVGNIYQLRFVIFSPFLIFLPWEKKLIWKNCIYSVKERDYGGTREYGKCHRCAGQLFYSGPRSAVTGQAVNSYYSICIGNYFMVFLTWLDHSLMVNPRCRPV